MKDEKKSNNTMKKNKVRCSCQDCGKSLANLSCLKTHQMKYHRTPTDFKCAPCNMYFDNYDLLRRHKEVCHGPNVFKCRVCNKGFSSAQYLSGHQIVHKPEKTQATCTICQKVIKNKRHMPEHMATVHGEKIKCDLCDYSTAHPRGMKKHIQNKHTDTPEEGPTLEEKEPTLEEKEPALEEKEPALEEKEPVLVEDKVTQKNKSAGSFGCSLCEAVLSYKAGLKRHLERVHGIKDTAKIEEICKSAGGVQKRVNVAEETIDTELKDVNDAPKQNHFCGPCEKYFPTEAALKEHFTSFHPPVKPICPQCGKQYSNDLCLTLHIKYLHGDKNYACSLCDYKTSKRVSLTAHMKTHQSKNIPCDICDEVLSSRLEFIRHKSAMHKTRPICEQCGSSWRDPSSLRKHMLRKHKILVLPDPPRVKVKAPSKKKASMELQAPIQPTIQDDNGSDNNGNEDAWSDMPLRDDYPSPAPSPATVNPNQSQNEMPVEAMVAIPDQGTPSSRQRTPSVKEEIVEEEVVFDATPFVVAEIAKTEIPSAPASEREASPMFDYASDSSDGVQDMPNYDSMEEEQEEVADEKLDLTDPPTLEFLDLFTYRCQYCRVIKNKPLELSNYKKMLVHFRSEHNTNGYAFCDTKKFSTEFIAAAYENSLITKKDPKKCPECKSLLAKNSTLADHLRMKHKLMFPPESEALIANYDEYFEYHCDECLDEGGQPKPLKNFAAMSKHFAKVHQLPGYAFCCDGKKIPRHLCKVHVDFHLVAKQIKCPDCRLYVSTEAVLRDHQETCKTLKQEKRTMKTTYDSTKNKPKPEILDSEKYDQFFKYHCEACPGEELKTFKQMSHHFRKVHKSRGYAFCCDKKFGRYSIRSHYLLHIDSSQLTCPECNFVATALSSFQRHLRVIHNQVTEPEGPELMREFDRLFEYRCEECPSMVDNEITSFAEMRDHFEQTHQSTGYVFCCGQKITRGFCEPHVEYHRRPDKYSCATCAAFFHSPATLRRHVKNKVCEKNLAAAEDGVAGKSSVSQGPHMEMYDKIFTYQCVDCVDSEGVMKKFVSYKDMRSHLKYAGHASKSMYAFCCGQQLPAARFPDHLRKHTRSPPPTLSLTCRVCNREFRKKVHLVKHFRIVHLNIKPVRPPPAELKRCGLCKIRFETHADFLQHRKDVHEPSMSCDKCGKVLANKKNLRQHIREVHPSSDTKAEDLICPECGKMMKTTEALRIHRRNSHLKPDLDCPYCPYTTKFKNCMNLHMAKHAK